MPARSSSNLVHTCRCREEVDFTRPDHLHLGSLRGRATACRLFVRGSQNSCRAIDRLDQEEAAEAFDVPRQAKTYVAPPTLECNFAGRLRLARKGGPPQ
jgi:hypothetical protein